MYLKINCCFPHILDPYQVKPMLPVLFLLWKLLYGTVQMSCILTSSPRLHVQSIHLSQKKLQKHKNDYKQKLISLPQNNKRKKFKNLAYFFNRKELMRMYILIFKEKMRVQSSISFQQKAMKYKDKRIYKWQERHRKEQPYNSLKQLHNYSRQ